MGDFFPLLWVCVANIVGIPQSVWPKVDGYNIREFFACM